MWVVFFTCFPYLLSFYYDYHLLIRHVPSGVCGLKFQLFKKTFLHKGNWVRFLTWVDLYLLYVALWKYVVIKVYRRPENVASLILLGKINERLSKANKNWRSEKFIYSRMSRKWAKLVIVILGSPYIDWKGCRYGWVETAQLREILYD